MGDAQYPGTKGTSRRVEGTGLAPDRHEHILNDFLGGGAANRLSCHVVNQRRITAVKRAERRSCRPAASWIISSSSLEIRVRLRCARPRSLLSSPEPGWTRYRDQSLVQGTRQVPGRPAGSRYLVVPRVGRVMFPSTFCADLVTMWPFSTVTEPNRVEVAAQPARHPACPSPTAGILPRAGRGRTPRRACWRPVPPRRP